MNEIRKLREQIDACRPGSDDLALPELADLAAAVERDRAVAAELARSQRFDHAVCVALHELPVPAGLMERLLAATEANQPTPAATLQQEPKDRQRRRWLVAVGAIAAMFLLAVTALWLAPRTPREVSQEELGLEVGQWYAARVPEAEWKIGKLPAGFAKPGNVIPNPGRWRQLTITNPSWSGKGVAIELQPATMPRSATLFVISSPVRFKVPDRPPTTGMTFTGVAGAKAIAWQNPTTNLLYVLVFDQDRHRLEQLIRQLPQA